MEIPFSFLHSLERGDNERFIRGCQSLMDVGNFGLPVISNGKTASTVFRRERSRFKFP